ncbi:hypothetical protein D1007_33182 [Hordeum vulgare]|nr:hypothetical protein D1007_33182 [Hordeum vulgare]
MVVVEEAQVLEVVFVIEGMSSSGSMTRSPCVDQEDMPKKWMAAELDKTKEKDVPTPPCWCAREEDRECREKEKNEKKKREEENECKEKEARQEERERKLTRARDAQAEDEAHDKKGKWPRTTQ